MKKTFRSLLACLLTLSLVMIGASVFTAAAAEKETPERHVIYSFSFDEPDATTLYKKSGATPGYIDREFYAGDAETGGSLALRISSAQCTGHGGVLPYIWPDGVSGVFNAQGDLEEGAYYELKVDIAWDGGVEVAKKGAYVYPFLLTNGGSENYMTGTDHTKQIGEEFQTFVYRLYKVSPDGYQTFDPPTPGSDSGGIAFCCENSLRKGACLRIDNIELAKVGGEFKEPEPGTIKYVTPVEAPTSYEVYDENGMTADGKQMTMLYENDFEDESRGTVFGHWNPAIKSAFLLKFKDGWRNNPTKSACYIMPKLDPGNFYTDIEAGGYYPVVWFWNEEMRDIYKSEKPLGPDDYYVFQFDITAKGAYFYPSLMIGDDEEYAPYYEWDSSGHVGSEAVQPLDYDFVTRYYVFKGEGIDVSKANTAFALFSDGYVNQHQPVYVDNFKFYSVRKPVAEPTEPDPTGTLDGIAGDANADNVVNMKDVLLLRKYMSGMEVTINEQAADVNCDAAINMKDVLILRRYLAGMETQLPIPAKGGEEEPTKSDDIPDAIKELLEKLVK